eukprot:5120497-Prymnesium_polylepis.1
MPPSGFHRAGLRANKAGDPAGAFQHFISSYSLAPTHAPHILSAANMAIKMNDEGRALLLYELAQRLVLTETQ